MRAFVLVELEGAWGTNALEARPLPASVRRQLRMLERQHRVRPLLIRRQGHRKGPDRPVSVFAVSSDPARQWIQRARLDDYEALLDLDFTGMATGRSPGLPAYDGPLFCVCTHGRHDACCAEQGRPFWEALREVAPEHTWQVSHIGGDRYAGNVLVLPDGLYYGRMEPPDAVPLAVAHARGELLLDHLRGRCAVPFAVQAAEIYLRRAHGLLGRDDVAFVGHRCDGELTTAELVVEGIRHVVQVRTTAAAPRQLTCRATALSRPLHHELIAID